MKRWFLFKRSPRIEDGQSIVVWFSCGAASAVAAKRTIEIYGKTNRVLIVNSPIKEEDEDNQRFLIDIQNWIGQEILQATNVNYPSCSIVDVWEDRQYMSGVKGAPCTKQLKKEARYQWQDKNLPDWHVLGFTYDEIARHKLFIIKETLNVIPVLASLGLSKPDCFKILSEAGIELPRIYSMGYPNANCIGCVKATSPTYWNHVRKMHPETFQQRAEQSREIGCRLVRVKGKRLFLDELSETAKGRSMKSMNVDCGIFCDTK